MNVISKFLMKKILSPQEHLEVILQRRYNFFELIIFAKKKIWRNFYNSFQRLFSKPSNRIFLQKIEIFFSKKVNIENNSIKVNNSLDYQTNIEGIYAIGDVNTYPGKLKLILSGFHEAAVMCHSAYSKLNPGKKNILKYTTVSGVEGFDGSKKEAKKSQIKKID